MHKCSIPLLLVLLFANGLPAQVDRYQLGLRLRAFERHLLATDDEERRDFAYAELNNAVQAFFRLDMSKVAKAIDAADIALRRLPPTVDHHFARSVMLKLDQRLTAAGEPHIGGKLEIAYALDGQFFTPRNWRLSMQLSCQEEPVIVPLENIPTTFELPLAGVVSGDHMLTWKLLRGDDVLVTREHGLSVARDPKARVDRLRQAAKTARSQRPATIESMTLPSLATQLLVMQRKRPSETVLPGHAMLLESEALAAWLAKPSERPFYGRHRTGDLRLRVPIHDKPVSVRLYAPEAPRERRPLVIAMHGAGGSENLFFDGYGDGLAVKLAAERGWFLVAPRASVSGVEAQALATALAERFDIDTKRVMLVGHSMGAMHAMRAAMQNPAAYQAVAALGGGGTVNKRAKLDDLPFLVAVGDRDFLRTGAEALHRNLERAGASSLWREYANVEHLAIVQVALPDVFAFFDFALRTK